MDIIIDNLENQQNKNQIDVILKIGGDILESSLNTGFVLLISRAGITNDTGKRMNSTPMMAIKKNMIFCQMFSVN